MIETEGTQAAPEAPPEQPKKRRQKKRDMMRIEALEKLMQETGGDVDPDTIVSMYFPHRRRKLLAAALLGSLAGGVVLNRLAYLLLLKIVRFPVSYSPAVCVPALGSTALLMCFVFLLILAFNLFARFLSRKRR